jgi:membrane protein YdbS with pleckstrin-like domain
LYWRENINNTTDNIEKKAVIIISTNFIFQLVIKPKYILRTLFDVEFQDINKNIPDIAIITSIPMYIMKNNLLLFILTKKAGPVAKRFKLINVKIYFL